MTGLLFKVSIEDLVLTAILAGVPVIVVSGVIVTIVVVVAAVVIAAVVIDVVGPDNDETAAELKVKVVAAVEVDGIIVEIIELEVVLNVVSEPFAEKVVK